MRVPRACLARQFVDQMHCEACGLTWDFNDPEPPACKKVDMRTKSAKAVLAFDPAPPKLKGLPEQLPADVLAEMEKAHRARGMQAAYRVLLDRIEP